MNEAETHIRQATVGDADSIVRLCEELGYSVNTIDMRLRLEQTSQRRDNVVFVAEDESHGVVGWVHVLTRTLLVAAPMGEIGGLVVAEECRKRGIGRRLMAAGEEWAKSKGLNTIVVRSNALRQEAHDFYPRLGYHMLKTQQVYTKIIGG